MHVADVRNYGFAGALTLESYPASPCDVWWQWMWDKGFLVRYGVTRFKWRLIS